MSIYETQGQGTTQKSSSGEHEALPIFTGKTMGLLTLQIPYEDNQYVIVSEMGIPLLEGGILYRGAISNISDDFICDLLLFINKNTFDYLLTVKTNSIEYNTFSLFTPDLLSKLLIYVDPENPQQFFGSVTQESTRVKYIYKDIREPITIGVTLLVVVAVGAALCAMSEIVGLYGNKKCKKIRVDYGFGWKDGRFQIGCKVECIGTK
jgi:hypothetical protein